MYFAYGWPRVAFSELPADDVFIYVHLTEKYAFAVSRKSVQLWTGGMNRVRLSECVRSEDDLKQEGFNAAAVWSAAKGTLAILVRRRCRGWGGRPGGLLGSLRTLIVGRCGADTGTSSSLQPLG